MLNVVCGEPEAAPDDRLARVELGRDLEVPNGILVAALEVQPVAEQGMRPRIAVITGEGTLEHERVGEPARKAPGRVGVSRRGSGGSCGRFAAESIERLGAVVVHERNGVAGARHGPTLGCLGGGVQHSESLLLEAERAVLTGQVEEMVGLDVQRFAREIPNPEIERIDRPRPVQQSFGLGLAPLAP